MFIDAQELKSRLNITQVAEYLGIVRKGRSWHCFNTAFHAHGDRNPSLSISERDGLFNCFACGVKGDVIHLWMEVRNVTFQIALEELAHTFVPGLCNSILPENKNNTVNLPPKHSQYNKPTTKYILKQVFEDIYKAFQTIAPLQNSGYDYLRNNRGFNDEIINKFGFFEISNLETYRNINNQLKNKFSLTDLQESGLFNNKGNLIFGTERIIIPFFFKGKLIYLQGRYIGNDTTIKARYINLSGIPYPLFNAECLLALETVNSLKDIDRWQKIVICEGVLNAISWMQLGQPAVACGSASKWNNSWAERYFKNRKVIVYLNFDNDPSGEKAYQKNEQGQFTHPLTKSLRSNDVTIKKPVPFPDGIKDANDYLKNYYSKTVSDDVSFFIDRFDQLVVDDEPFLSTYEIQTTVMERMIAKNRALLSLINQFDCHIIA